jgi:hypothetical protein
MISDRFFWLNPLLLSLSPQPMLFLVSGAPATTAMETTTTTMAGSVGIAKTIAVTRGVMIVPSNRGVVEAVDHPEEGAAEGVDGAGLPPGLMPRAKYATRRGTMQKIAGLAMLMMMIIVRKKFMPPTVWTPTGTRTLELPTTSQESSTI